MIDVVMVRVYFTEAKHLLDEIMVYLHDQAKVKGVTVYRGITGFGPSGKIHGSKLLDLSLDLPVTVEFFDTSDNIAPVIDYLSSILEPGHIVSWPAKANV